MLVPVGAVLVGSKGTPEFTIGESADAEVTTMFNGIKVIDADGHVMEPNELYGQYIDPRFRSIWRT